MDAKPLQVNADFTVWSRTAEQHYFRTGLPEANRRHVEEGVPTWWFGPYPTAAEAETAARAYFQEVVQRVLDSMRQPQLFPAPVPLAWVDVRDLT